MKVFIAIALMMVPLLFGCERPNAASQITTQATTAEAQALEATIILTPSGWQNILRIRDRETGNVIYLTGNGSVMVVSK